MRERVRKSGDIRVIRVIRIIRVIRVIGAIRVIRVIDNTRTYTHTPIPLL